jgi:hypothetical protein
MTAKAKRSADYLSDIEVIADRISADGAFGMCRLKKRSSSQRRTIQDLSARLWRWH